MDLPQIQITQQNAKLQTETQQGHFQMRQRSADMRIRQTPANIGMHTEHAQIFIDQRQAFNEVNLKHIFRRIEDYAAKGRQEVLKGIARRASDGDRMRDIHIPSNPFVEFAKRDQSKRVDFNVKFAPSFGSVKFSHKPTKTTFHVRPHEVNIDVTMNLPERHYTPSKVNSYLAQKNQIKFDVIGGNVNKGF